MLSSPKTNSRCGGRGRGGRGPRFVLLSDFCGMSWKELAAARKPEDQRAKYLAAKNTLKEAAGTA